MAPVHLTVTTEEQVRITLEKVYVSDNPDQELLWRAAQEYQCAANTVFALKATFELPTYFLHTHAIELALKAFLCSRTGRVRVGHRLKPILQECLKEGLTPSFELERVVGLLKYENDQHGFRYYKFLSLARPEIGYLNEVMNTLFNSVSQQVAIVPARKDIVLKSTVHKPEKRDAEEG
jgi:HEPN domain-containing protein